MQKMGKYSFLKRTRIKSIIKGRKDIRFYMINISSSKYNKPIEVEIDGERFEVRKIGAGTQLDLSQIVARITKAKTDALNLTATEKEDSDKLSQAMDKVAKLIKELEQTFMTLFSDNANGEKVKELFNKVGMENIPQLLADIYEQAKGQ